MIFTRYTICSQSDAVELGTGSDACGIDSTDSDGTNGLANKSGGGGGGGDFPGVLDLTIGTA